MLLEVGGRLPLKMAEEIVAQVELYFAGNADDDPASKKEEDALAGGNSYQQPGIAENLLPGDAVVQVIDGDTNDLGKKDPEGIGGHRDQSAPDKVPPIAAQIGEERPKGSKHAL